MLFTLVVWENKHFNLKLVNVLLFQVLSLHPPYCSMSLTGHSHIIDGPVGWGCRIHQLHICRGVRHSSECPAYDTKESDGRPALARPYVGVHRSTSLMSLSLLLQQCHACLVRLTWVAFLMGGRWPYSWCFVGCCRQDWFNIARNILV